jgi:tetratricopeptide (TPR) repeat protein
MDNFAESEKAYAIALDVARRVLDTDEPNLFVIMGNRAAALRELGRRSEALELLNQVIAFHEGRGSTPAALITPLHNRGGIARELKQFDSAIVDFTRALELAGSLTGQKRHESRSLVGLGITLVESGRPAAAIEPLERAIQDQTPGRDENVQLEGRWMLGRARVEARRDVARGLAEVRSAREAVAAAGGTPQDLVEIDAWMAKHGGR